MVHLFYYLVFPIFVFFFYVLIINFCVCNYEYFQLLHFVIVLVSLSLSVFLKLVSYRRSHVYTYIPSGIEISNFIPLIFIWPAEHADKPHKFTHKRNTQRLVYIYSIYFNYFPWPWLSLNALISKIVVSLFLDSKQKKPNVLKWSQINFFFF